jgi:hypothetical protein
MSIENFQRCEITINRDALIDRFLTLVDGRLIMADVEIRARVMIEINPETQRREMTVATIDGVRLFGIAFAPGETVP